MKVEGTVLLAGGPLFYPATSQTTGFAAQEGSKKSPVLGRQELGYCPVWGLEQMGVPTKRA